MKRQMKKTAAVLISAAMVLQNSMIPARGADHSHKDEYSGPGLYREGTLLQDGDTIGEDSILEWKTEISFSDQTEVWRFLQ